VEHPTRIFVDTSKSVFQVHGVNAAEMVVIRRKQSRGQFTKFLSELGPTVVGFEACGASHHWAREAMRHGHQVRLVPTQYAKAYLKRSKNDARDAEAGCEAMSRPTMSFVAVKSETQQAAGMLISVRQTLVRRHTQLGNTIRGHAAEFGLVSALGTDKIAPLLQRIASDPAVPALARDLFAELGGEWAELEARLGRIERRLLSSHRADPTRTRLGKIPSLGPIGAAMLLAKVIDPHAFKSARHLPAWTGLTPTDHSTAGKQRLGVITKAGDEALRAVLVSGGMSLVKVAQRQPDRAWPWLVELLKRKSPKEAAVAVANKVARIAWKMLVTGEEYDPKRMMRPVERSDRNALAKAA
jgi:transposase